MMIMFVVVNRLSLCVHVGVFSQTPSSFSGTMSPQGIVVPTSALQQGSLTVTAMNPTQVVSGVLLSQHTAMLTTFCLSCTTYTFYHKMYFFLG